MHELRSIFHASYFLHPCECSKRSFYSVNMRSGLEGVKLAVPGNSVITQEMGPQHLREYAVSFLFVSSPVPAIVFILSPMWASGRCTPFYSRIRNQTDEKRNVDSRGLSKVGESRNSSVQIQPRKLEGTEHNRVRDHGDNI